MSEEDEHIRKPASPTAYSPHAEKPGVVLTMLAGSACAILALLSWSGAILLLLYQGYVWLRSEHWRDVTALTAFRDLEAGAFFEWLQEADWAGLKSLIWHLLNAPLYAVLLALGLILLIVGVGVLSRD